MSSVQNPCYLDSDSEKARELTGKGLAGRHRRKATCMGKEKNKITRKLKEGTWALRPGRGNYNNIKGRRIEKDHGGQSRSQFSHIH